MTIKSESIEETWEDIPGFEGVFERSNRNNVRVKNARPPKLIPPFEYRNYPVELCSVFCNEWAIYSKHKKFDVEITNRFKFKRLVYQENMQSLLDFYIDATLESNNEIIRLSIPKNEFILLSNTMHYDQERNSGF